MKYKTEILDFYAQKPGVIISLIVTLFSTLFLVSSLVSREFHYRDYESVAIPSLIFEFVYGTVLSFLILRDKKTYIHLTSFLILNWFIGCFSLNTLIPIFQDLPVWVYIATFAFCISNFFIYSNSEGNSKTFYYFFINGFSFTIILYFTLYLIPVMPYSFIGIIALGLGFYGLVPAIVIIIHTLTVLRYLTRNRIYFISFTAGFSIVVISLIVFTIGLSLESNKIAKTAMVKSFNNDDDLPNYIAVSQNLKPNFLNEILLKKDIVYIGPDDFFSFDNFNTFSKQQFNALHLL
jgi:XrtN system VIT domain protein